MYVCGKKYEHSSGQKIWEPGIQAAYANNVGG
jgi:hypothetical protein